MTGGGFGGCTVTLIDRKEVPTLQAHLSLRYTERTAKLAKEAGQDSKGLHCDTYVVSPADGARVIQLSAADFGGKPNTTDSGKVAEPEHTSYWSIMFTQLTWILPATTFLLAIIVAKYFSSSSDAA